MMGADAEDHYVARMQEVYDGHPALGNVFLSEKNQPSIIPSLGEESIAYAGKALGMSAVDVNIFSKFLLPALVALLVYLFVYLLSESVASSVIASSFAVLGDTLLSGASAWRALVQIGMPSGAFLAYSRPINPEVTGLFLFATLFVLYRAFFRHKKVQVWEFILVGVLVGASAYVSPYTFTFLVVCIACAGAWFLYRREYGLFISACSSGLVAGLVIVPFLFNYVQLRASPLYAETAVRFGVVSGHGFVLSMWLVLLLVGVLFAWPTRFREARPFLLCMIGALWILTEQQVITGVQIQSSHYHWYITKPLAGIVLSLYAVWGIERMVSVRWMRIGAYTLILGVLLYNAALIQRYSYRIGVDAATSAQDYAPVLRYLTSISTRESVWGDVLMSSYIPVYTAHDAPNNEYAQYYLVRNEYLVRRLLLTYRLRGISSNSILAQIKTDRVIFAKDVYGLYWRDQYGSYESIPDSLLENFAQQYRDLSTTSTERMMQDMGITTVVWDRIAEPSWHLENTGFLTESYTDGRFSVYRLQ